MKMKYYLKEGEYGPERLVLPFKFRNSLIILPALWYNSLGKYQIQGRKKGQLIQKIKLP